MADIAASSAFCNEEDSTTRYMISICVSFNHLKDDPRCPVRIGNDERKQYYIISRHFVSSPHVDPHQSHDPFRSYLFDGQSAFPAISAAGDDEMVSAMNSAVRMGSGCQLVLWLS